MYAINRYIVSNATKTGSNKFVGDLHTSFFIFLFVELTEMVVYVLPL